MKNTDVCGIGILVIANNDLSNISGIEYLYNLWLLMLTEGQIQDLSPVSYLENLTALRLEMNQINDINPLSGLLLLKELSLASNQISDISPLVINSGASGLGPDDYVNIQDKNLDSGDCGNISTLESSGVLIDHDLTCE